MTSWQARPATFELGSDGPAALVVGVDDSPTSMRALAYAAGVARRQHARLVVVFVRTLRGIGLDALYGFDGSGATAQAALEAQDEVEADLRAEVEQLCRAWDMEVQVVVRDGDPLKELAAVAEREHADAIIVGSSTRIGHRLTGSVAVRLVRQRGWPVTVIP